MKRYAPQEIADSCGFDLHGKDDPFDRILSIINDEDYEDGVKGGVLIILSKGIMEGFDYLQGLEMVCRFIGFCFEDKYDLTTRPFDYDSLAPHIKRASEIINYYHGLEITQGDEDGKSKDGNSKSM